MNIRFDRVITRIEGDRIFVDAPLANSFETGDYGGGTIRKYTWSGRIANVVAGFAVFTLMDSSLPYCGEKNKEDGCKTPWDYCCESSDTRTANSLLVEVRDAKGKPIAGSLGDLRLLDAVTVVGKLTKDEHGNHVLLATGWHRDARPELPADLRWPN